MLDSGSNNIKSSKFIKITTSSSHRVLSSSLSWFGLGFAIVFLLGYGFSEINVLKNIFYKIIQIRYGFILLSILAIGLMLVIMFSAQKMSIEVLAVLYVAFCMVESIYVAVIFISYADNFNKLLLVFGIPAATFVIMGLLGYFQIINFSKLAHFLFIALIGLLAFGIITFFIVNSIFITIYCIVGYIIFTLYVGYDLWRISKLDELDNNGFEMDKQTIRKQGLLFGLMLLIDFIQLVWFIARLIKF